MNGVFSTNPDGVQSGTAGNDANSGLGNANSGQGNENPSIGNVAQNVLAGFSTAPTNIEPTMTQHVVYMPPTAPIDDTSIDSIGAALKRLESGRQEGDERELMESLQDETALHAILKKYPRVLLYAAGDMQSRRDLVACALNQILDQGDKEYAQDLLDILWAVPQEIQRDPLIYELVLDALPLGLWLDMPNARWCLANQPNDWWFKQLDVRLEEPNDVYEIFSLLPLDLQRDSTLAKDLLDNLSTMQKYSGYTTIDSDTEEGVNMACTYIMDAGHRNNRDIVLHALKLFEHYPLVMKEVSWISIPLLQDPVIKSYFPDFANAEYALSVLQNVDHELSQQDTGILLMRTLKQHGSHYSIVLLALQIALDRKISIGRHCIDSGLWQDTKIALILEKMEELREDNKHAERKELRLRNVRPVKRRRL